VPCSVLGAGATAARSASFAASIPPSPTFDPIGTPPARRRLAPSHYDRVVRLAVRLALIVLGLAAVVYGAASLTGGWLGTPSWWEREETATEYRDRFVSGRSHAGGSPGRRFDMIVPEVRTVPREGREWISGGVMAVGASRSLRSGRIWGACARR
jgi:hypothetical protein